MSHSPYSQTTTMWVHNIQVMSHLFSVPGIVKATSEHRLLDTVMMIVVVFNSILMHLSETKHSLTPDTEWLRSYSRTFLNMDRISAYLGSLYFAYTKVLPHIELHGLDIKIRHSCIWSIIAVLNLAIGERSTNLAVYVVTHTLWHAIVFSFFYVW